MSHPYRFLLFLPLLVLILASCGGENERLNFEKKGREVPEFQQDSAYRFIEEQIDFGPRNPGSDGHRKTLKYLKNKLTSYAGSNFVYVQRFTAEGYNGETLNLANIIASFNPRAQDRILLCAHWDTRPRAEKAEKSRDKPILGADDGASGVAVLLEIARLFNRKSPPVGVDIVLFDGEDYGKSGDRNKYFLGSRYWANNPPVKNYRPRFGILLDMVGGRDATFLKEQMSMRFAPALMNEIWSIAGEKEYGNYFVNKQGASISDDHVVINQILQIPTIDVINHQVDSEGQVEFPSYWHTHQDDLSIISRETLGATGSVLTELIFNRL